MATASPPTKHSKESANIAPVRTAAEPQSVHELARPSIALMETERVLPGSRNLRQNNMLALQRLVGNRAVQRLMIQREDEVADADAGDAEAEKKKVEREEFQKGVSTPVPIDAVIGAGEATVEVGGAIVTILPDGASEDEKLKNQAVTSGGLTGWGIPGYMTDADGKIESFDEIKTPKVTIQTVYGPGTKASDESGYGRGTTEEDKEAKNSSLGFHEGMHGKTTLDYLKNKPLPEFTGAIGDTEDDFKKARDEYERKMKEADAELQKLQISSVDCVGKAADFCEDDGEEEGAHEH